MRHPIRAALSIATLVTLATCVNAVPLSPGEQVSLGGTTLAAEPYLAAVVGAGQTIPLSITDINGQTVFTGELRLSINRSELLGTLEFSCRVIGASSTGDSAVARIDWAGFEGFSTNVNYRIDGLGTVGPNAASRTGGGDEVRFLFGSGVAGGQNSRFFYSLTNAVAHDLSGRIVVRLTTGERHIVEGVLAPALPPSCPGDTNRDGAVNFADLNTVLTNFGQNCP